MKTMQVGADGVALMVQVSTETEIVVEYPRGRCSKELKELLTDPSVTKVGRGVLINFNFPYNLSLISACVSRVTIHKQVFCGVEGDEKHLDCRISGSVVDIMEVGIHLSCCSSIHLLLLFTTWNYIISLHIHNAFADGLTAFWIW
jgi:hypothetical protein